MAPFSIIFSLIVFGICLAQKSEISEEEQIREAIKQYEVEGFERNKLTICTYALAELLNQKSDIISIRLEGEEKENKDIILFKLYFQSIDACLSKMRVEYPETYVGMNFIEEIKWEEYLEIDLSKLEAYRHPLTQSEKMIQISIERFIDAPILDKKSLFSAFGYRINYSDLPYIAVIGSLTFISYGIYISNL